jgi:PAS domain S-box-containing protein
VPETRKTQPSSLGVNALPATDEASQRLAAIVDSSDDAIISKDLNGIINTWNPAATKIFGYQPEEIIGRSILTLIPPELHHEEDEILRKLRAGERIHHYETIRLRKDGTRFHISVTISPIRNHQGNVIGGSKIGRDISDRRRSDEARFRLAAIVDSSEDAIISKDLNGIIASWNAAATRLFGWQEHEIVGRSILTLIPPELHSEEPEILRKLSDGERIEHYETRRVRKDGQIVEVSLTVSPIKDPMGRVIGGSKIARDISEHRRIQQALMDSEKLAVTGRMAAAIAHEINNPLEAVTNLAYLLSTDTSLSGRARHYAHMILEEISRASQISRQTLAFYRETGSQSEIDVCSILDGVLEFNKQRLENKKISLQRDYAPVGYGFGYPGEIRQVFANLISNAIDATPAGGAIIVRVREDPAHRNGRRRIRISLADTGSGVPVEIRGRIFRPFFTTKGSIGSGLGLWVSQGIVEKHGGKISLRSSTAPGRSGTVFTLFLPMYRTGESLPFTRAEEVAS